MVHRAPLVYESVREPGGGLWDGRGTQAGSVVGSGSPNKERKGREGEAAKLGDEKRSSKPGQAANKATPQRRRMAGEESEEESEEAAEEEALVLESEGVRLHLSANSSAGYLGVFRNGARFRAQYTREDGTRVSLGSFHTAREAAVAYAKLVPAPRASCADEEEAVERASSRSKRAPEGRRSGQKASMDRRRRVG